MRILITGAAGSGKTTIIGALRDKGFTALDLDDCDVCTYVHKKTGEPATYVEGAGREWIESHRWVVIIPKLRELLSAYPDDEIIFVGGKVAKVQADEISSIFDHMFLLRPQDEILDDRLRTRESNKDNFAKTKEERDGILQGRHEFEKRYIEAGAIVVENHGEPESAVEEILVACGAGEKR